VTSVRTKIRQKKKKKKGEGKKEGGLVKMRLLNRQSGGKKKKKKRLGPFHDGEERRKGYSLATTYLAKGRKGGKKGEAGSILDLGEKKFALRFPGRSIMPGRERGRGKATFSLERKIVLQTGPYFLCQCARKGEKEEKGSSPIYRSHHRGGGKKKKKGGGGILSRISRMRSL